jgi:hypothetical protein
MYGMTRGVTTLIGVAGAGCLVWLAAQLDPDVTGEYWALIGLVAAAGLALSLSQLVGGWTKWGRPQVTGAVFLLGFVPALVAGGLVLLHAQPDSGDFASGWAGDLGLGGLADDLAEVVLPIAFGIGLVFGMTFDTAGRRVVAADEEVAEGRPVHVGPLPGYASTDTDEPVTAEREAVASGDVERDHERVGEHDDDYAVAGPARDRPRRSFLRR